MKKVDFRHGSIWGNILQTAFPMLIAQVISLLYNIVDRIYIGRIEGIGTSALGAVGLCYPVIILTMAFTNMFGLGGAPLFSMELGKGNRKKAAAILNSAFRLEIVASLVILIVVEIFSGPLLLLFGATPVELVYSQPYLQIYILGTTFAMISTGINPYINGQGYATIGMMTVTIGAVTNLILDPIFIFTLGLGVNGAAIATVLAQFLSALFVLSFLFGKKNEFRISFKKRIPCGEYVRLESSDIYKKKESTNRIDRSMSSDDLAKVSSDENNDMHVEKTSFFPFMKDIVALGMAPFIMQFTNSMVSVACNSVLMRTGGAAFVSVMTIINSVRQILDTPVMALTEGASPTISYNYGARRPDKVKKAVKIMASVAMSYTLIMWLVIERFPGSLIGIFTTDLELKALAIRPLHLYFYAFIFQSFQYSGQTVFKALNKKNKAIFFSIFRKVVLVVPLTYGLSYLFGMGTDGVFIAEPVSNLVGGVACFITMLVTVMPELRKLGEA